MSSKKKTKLSGIMDNSSMGISLGSTEMQIQTLTATTLRKRMRKHPAFFPNSDNLQNDITYILTVDEAKIVYEFKRQGKNTFLNVSGNPTKLMTGSNSVPVLLKGGEFEGNAVLNTFKYANRIMYALLEFIPGFDFKWPKRERLTLVAGDFNGSRLQYAWYSSDLISREQRSEVLRFIRTCYGGQNVSKTEVSNIAQGMSLNYTAWDPNSKNKNGELIANDNITIAGQVGDKKDFSLTLYTKDDEMREEKGSSRFQSLIRFDGTFNDYFLRQHGIKKVADLEVVYENLCEENGYDVGFVKWLAGIIHSRLKMRYILTLDGDVYDEMLEKCETYLAKRKSKDEAVMKLLHHWHTFGVTYATSAAKCEALGVNISNYARAVTRILELTGIDIDISRSHHDAMLLNRAIATMSVEERSAFYHASRNSNEALSMIELKERDRLMSRKIAPLITSDGAIQLRRLKPVTLASSEFWIYRMLNKEFGHLKAAA